MSDETKYDVRILDRMVETGRVTKKEVDAVLKNLPDVADKADNLEASLADRNDAASPAAKAPKKKAGKKAK